MDFEKVVDEIVQQVFGEEISEEDRARILKTLRVEYNRIVDNAPKNEKLREYAENVARHFAFLEAKEIKESGRW